MLSLAKSNDIGHPLFGHAISISLTFFLLSGKMPSYSYRNRSRDSNRLHIIRHACHVKVNCLKELILREMSSKTEIIIICYANEIESLDKIKKYAQLRSLNCDTSCSSL